VIAPTAKDRVARQRRLVGAAGEHHRDDQGHLDHRHGDGEDERAERLVDAMGDDLGVVHRGQHRAEESGDGDDDEGQADRQHQRREVGAAAKREA